MSKIRIAAYLGCNLKCKYCHNQKLREKLYGGTYNLDEVIKTMRKLYSQRPVDGIVLHEGESLLMPIEDIEKLLSEICQLQGFSAIQTNGSLITKEHIELFKKYKTEVSISVDGPDELNEFRTSKKTTQKIIKIIEQIQKEKLHIKIMIVLHKANAGTAQRLDKLKQFLEKMESLRIECEFSLMLGENDCSLLPARLIYVCKEIAQWMLEKGYQWKPFRSIWNALQTGNFLTRCDYYCTPLLTILGDGTVVSCLKRNEPLLQHPVSMDYREEMLLQVPMEYGGCKECRWFMFCNGGCPGNGVNRDWRNRDINCPAYKAIFEFAEKSLNAQGINICYTKQAPEIQTMVGGHSDRIEHTDSDIRHLDSNIGKREHTDGIEHVDGDIQHMDGNR